MSNLTQEKIILDENINDIFDQKIEVGAVIQFNLLQRIIEEFIKRQKSLSDKVNNLELIINQSMSQDNKDKYNESRTNLDFFKDKEIIIKEKVNSNENKNLSLNIDKMGKSEREERSIRQEKKDKDADDNIEQNKTEKINNQYRILSSRFDKFEKAVNDLNKKVNNQNETNKNNEQKEIFEKLIKKQDDKIDQLENEINYINEKIKEMNILQVEFSNDNKEESEESKNKNAQLLKILTKKIDLIESKSKKYDDDIFKVKKDLAGINTLLSKDNNNYNNFKNDINKKYTEFTAGINEDINTLKNLMNEKGQKIKNDLINEFDKEIKNIKQMINELKNNMDNNIEGNSIENILNSSKFNEKLSDKYNDLKNLMNKNLLETEKNIKSIINNLGIEAIKRQLSSIQENLNEKLVKTDLDYIDIKIKDIENRLISDELKLETLEKDIIVFNDSNSKSIKMIEFLSGQVLKNDQEQKKVEEKKDIQKHIQIFEEKDMKSFVNKDEFNQEVKNIYKRIEQILLVENENYKFIQYIESRLKFYVTQNDFKTLEQCLMNTLEDLKNNFMKKYMEKTEILKSIKYLEIQMKNLHEANPPTNKEGENWMLAKKPLNNYLCASCEAVIGELKNKNTFLPWNKITPHENAKYRMGNGFSRMLELVNTDLMKNAEKINDNMIIKLDEKKNNFDNVFSLPRLKSQINLKKWKNKTSTFYVTNNENIEKKLNNSMEGFDINSSNKINMSDTNNKKRRNNDKRYNNIEKNINNFGGGKFSYDKDFSNSPTVLKITKKIKKDI